MDEKTKAGYFGDIEYFSAKLEEDKNSIVFLPLASAYIKIGSYNDALNILLQGIDANPEMPMAKAMLAEAYIGLGQNEDAKSVLTELRVIDPANYLAEKLLGDVYRNENNLKKALISYKNAFGTAPEDTELRDLITELIAHSGLDERELYDDRPIEANEEEMLDSLGQELMDEVKNDLGENVSGEITEEVVKQTVDEIVGASDGDKSLESFADEYISGEIPDEIEEEAIADVDDEVRNTNSLDAMKDAVKDEVPFVAEEPEEDSENPEIIEDISGMAAELSADFGLDEINQPETVEHEIEESDSAESSHDEDAEPLVNEKETPDAGVFENIAEMDEMADDEMLADATEMISPVSLVDESGQIESEDGSQPCNIFDGEQPVAVDEHSGEAVEPVEKDVSEERVTTEEINELTAEQPVVETIEETAEEQTEEAVTENTAESAKEEIPEQQAENPEPESRSNAEEAETVDEIITHKNFGVPVIDVQAFEKEQTDDVEPEPVYAEPVDVEAMREELSEPVIIDETSDEVVITPEDEQAVEEVRVELDQDEKLDEELSILFAIDELSEKTQVKDEVEHENATYDDLDPATHEQVNKLENLLELIKSNAK